MTNKPSDYKKTKMDPHISKLGKLKQPLSTEKMTSAIQKFAKKNIKKTKEEAPKRKLKWRSTEIIPLIRQTGRENVQANPIHRKPNH
jgi:hypothetical protein